MAKFVVVVLELRPVQVGYHPNLGKLKDLDAIRNSENPRPEGMRTYHCNDPEGLVGVSHLDEMVKITVQGSGTNPWHHMKIVAVEPYEE